MLSVFSNAVGSLQDLRLSCLDIYIIYAIHMIFFILYFGGMSFIVDLHHIAHAMKDLSLST